MKLFDSNIRCGLAAAVLVAWGGMGTAHADDPTFVLGNKGDIKDVKDVQWTAKGEAGLVSTTGNSKTTTVTAGLNLTRKDKDNKFDAALNGAFARSTVRIAADDNGNGAIDNGELHTATSNTAEDATLKLRYDRYITELNAFYVTGVAATDRPAGKDFVGGGQAGYSRGVYKDDTHEVLAEIGYDLSYLRLSDETSTTIHSLRAFLGYKAKFEKTATVDASVEGLFNGNTVTIGNERAKAFKDTRLNANLAVTASLSAKLSLAASFTAKFDNVPAPLAQIGDLPFAADFAPTADKLDTITKVSLIVKFL
ncbi:MAG TPA: DUF481 domain-containing protein [Kofleriaceae bacterium]|nr:DUF481 domain-containing protein [Kofleriaceae bacterium]